MTALFLWTLQATKANGNGYQKPETAEEAEEDPGDDEDESKPKNALYPDGSDERRMLEGVQAAMRGVH